MFSRIVEFETAIRPQRPTDSEETEQHRLSNDIQLHERTRVGMATKAQARKLRREARIRDADPNNNPDKDFWNVGNLIGVVIPDYLLNQVDKSKKE